MAKLPRYVAFKGQNGSFLVPHDQERHVFLRFSESELASPNARHEVVPVAGGNGNVQIKCLWNNKYWRRSPNWIWPDADNPTPSNKDCLFRPVAVDSHTVALQCVANNAFLIPLTTEGKVGCLNAAVSTLTTDTRMTVMEPVLKRRVHSVVYDVASAKVDQGAPTVLGTRKAVNKSPFKADVAMSFAYTQTKTSSWNISSTIGMGVEASITAGVPSVSEATITISTQYSVTTEMGKTVEESQSLVDTYTVKDLPPKGSVTVKLSGTQAECDVPFKTPFSPEKSSLQSSTMASTKAPISPSSTGNPLGAKAESLPYDIIIYIMKNKLLRNQPCSGFIARFRTSPVFLSWTAATCVVTVLGFALHLPLRPRGGKLPVMNIYNFLVESLRERGSSATKITRPR